MFNSPKLLKNVKALDSVLMTADRISSVIDIGESTGYAVHAIWTGTPQGTIRVQASNDGINFVDVDTQAAGGASGQKMVNLANQMYSYVRIYYTFTSSTGSLTAYVSSKG